MYLSETPCAAVRNIAPLARYSCAFPAGLARNAMRGTAPAAIFAISVARYVDQRRHGAGRLAVFPQRSFVGIVREHVPMQARGDGRVENSPILLYGKFSTEGHEITPSHWAPGSKTAAPEKIQSRRYRTSEQAGSHCLGSSPPQEELRSGAATHSGHPRLNGIGVRDGSSYRHLDHVSDRLHFEDGCFGTTVRQIKRTSGSYPSDSIANRCRHSRQS